MSTSKWREGNREQARAICLAWRNANREYANTQSSAYKKRRPDKNRLWARNRRARVRQAKGTHTVEDVAKQYAAQGGICYWCPRELSDKFHADHLIPLNRGGSNGPDNIVCACQRCNTSRQDRLPSEWKAA